MMAVVTSGLDKDQQELILGDHSISAVYSTTSLALRKATDLRRIAIDRAVKHGAEKHGDAAFSMSMQALEEKTMIALSEAVFYQMVYRWVEGGRKL